MSPITLLISFDAGLAFSATSQRYAITSAHEARAYLDHPILGPRLLECTESLVRLEGRTATEIFGTPDDLKLRCDVAEERLRKIVGDRAQTTIVSSSNPFVMHVVEGFETMVASFGSDVPYLTNLGKPILIGPGSILDAHTANEKVSKQELMEGAAIYERLVQKLVS